MISLPLTAFYTAFEKIVLAYSIKINSNHDPIVIEQYIPDQLNHLKNDLIPSLAVSNILSYALDEIIINWKSLYMLEFQEPANMHFRKIMECTSILFFLAANRPKWKKYSKKWQLYPQAEVFGRWSQTERSLWHPETEENFNNMSLIYSDKYKDFEIFFKSNQANLTGNLESDLPKFQKIDSWISPMRFSNLLEGTHSDKTTLSNFYDWWSNSVHFSPLNYTIKNVNTSHGSSMEIGLLAITLELSTLIRKLAPMTTKFEKYYYLSSMITYESMLQDAKKHPDGFIDKFSIPDDYTAALFLLASEHISVDKFLSKFHSDFEGLKEENKLLLS